MSFLLRRLVVASALLLTVPVLLGVLHLAAPPAQEPDSSAFRSGGDHIGAWAQDARSGYQVAAAVSGPFLADDADGTLVVVHTPQQPPDQAFLDDHLAGGGSLWILDPEGTYNPWLSSHGAAVDSDNRLVDPDSPHGAGTVRMQGAESQVIARSPASLLLDEGWETWLTSDAHLDLDGDGTVDRSDAPGPHPVGAVKYVGRGQLFVTADGSLLSDDLRDVSENAGFARWVARQLLPDGGTLVIDESQHGWTPAERLPVAAVQSVQTVHALPTWAALLVTAMVAAGAVLLARKAHALHPYKEHERHDPATPPPQQENTVTVEESAWELLAIRTRQPVDRLKRAGTEAAHGLAEDPALRRILLGRAQPADAAKILSDYLESQNIHPGPQRINGAKP